MSLKNILDKKVTMDDLGKFLDHLDTVIGYLTIGIGLLLVIINLVR